MVIDPSQITPVMMTKYRAAHEAQTEIYGYSGDDCIRAGLAAVLEDTNTAKLLQVEPPVWDGSDDCYHEHTAELGPHHLDTWFRALELTNRSQYTPEEHVEAATIYLRILLSPPVIPDA